MMRDDPPEAFARREDRPNPEPNQRYECFVDMDRPEESSMARRKRPAPDPCRVIIYLRCSTEEQVVSGLGLAAQESACRAEAQRRGGTVVEVFIDPGVAGSVSPTSRPGLAAALAALGSRQAGVLMVARLDRLTRSLGDLCVLMAEADRAGWSLTATDGTLDTTTPMGRAMAQMAGVFSELERNLIGERTRAALAAKKAQGFRLGRPVTLPEATRLRVVELRETGLTLAQVAATLDAEGHETARGGRWAPGTVDAVLRSVRLDAEAVAL